MPIICQIFGMLQVFIHECFIDLFLFYLLSEEASKLWEKRKEEWTLEAIARDELINDVITASSFFSVHILI